MLLGYIGHRNQSRKKPSQPIMAKLPDYVMEKLVYFDSGVRLVGWPEDRSASDL